MITEERITIGASTPIQGTLLYPDSLRMTARVLLSCPHPMLGGRADNPVVTTMARTFAEAGCVVLVYEYYEGPRIDINDGLIADHSGMAPTHEHLDEARHCLSWLGGLGNSASSSPLLLAGYSYGGAISIELGTAYPVLAISPPLRVLSNERPINWRQVTVVKAESDFALETSECRQTAPETDRPHLRVIAGADHFYTDHLACVSNSVNEWIKDQTSLRPQLSNLL